MDKENPARRWQRIALGSTLALLVLGVAWEMWLTPLRPGGSFLVLKVVPLLFALPGLFAGRRYTFQWAAMLVLAYFTEGVVRAWSDLGPSRFLGMIEIALSLIAYASMVIYCKLTRGQARERATATAD
jgi:uncharacterized membrane protein